MDHIYDFVDDVCYILKIRMPEVSFDKSHFCTDTMLAQCRSDGKKIYIDIGRGISSDLFFAIAHELRHVWQIRQQGSYFSDYKTIDACSDHEEYNLQKEEIDANAFASIVMHDFFGISPLFNGLSDRVKNKIHQRISYLESVL